MFLNNRAAMIRSLSSDGYVFSESVQSTEGSYESADADWNYRDIPHLNFVHTQAESVIAVAADDITTSLIVQKIGPIKIVLTLVIMSRENSQLYYTSVGPVVIIVETNWQSTKTNITSVTTTYSVGTTRLVKFVQPLIHKVLARNYKILMSEDLPMREQRGRLRQKGYTFRQDRDGHSYVDSMAINVENVETPFFPPSNVSIRLDEIVEYPKLFQDVVTGREIVAWKLHEKIFIGQSFCPHEGANLVEQNCSEYGIVCPWHGRLNPPIATLNLSSGDLSLKTGSIVKNIVVNSTTVEVLLDAQETARESD